MGKAIPGFDQQDVEDIALCSWMEARGDGASGMTAVVCVIINRVGTPGFAYGIHGVIYGKNQFSWTRPDDPEFNTRPAANDPLYTTMLQAVPQMLQGNYTDTTNGAHWYANLKTVTSGWFYDNIIQNPSNHPQTITIGHHTFFA